MGYESAGKVKTAKFSVLTSLCRGNGTEPVPLLLSVCDCTNIKRSPNKLC